MKNFNMQKNVGKAIPRQSQRGGTRVAKGAGLRTSDTTGYTITHKNVLKLMYDTL